MTVAADLLGARSETATGRVSVHGAVTGSVELPDSPWARNHRIRLGVLAGLGTAGATVCWYGGSGTGEQDRQVWWLVGSVFSLVVILVSGVGWILQGLRAVKRAERELLHFLRDSAQGTGHAPLGSEGSQRHVSAPGMTRYHLESCPLVAGKPAITHTGRTHTGEMHAGERVLAPCGVCLS